MKRLLLCSLLAIGPCLHAMQPGDAAVTSNGGQLPQLSMMAQVKQYINLKQLLAGIGALLADDAEAKSSLLLTKEIVDTFIDALKLEHFEVTINRTTEGSASCAPQARSAKLGELFDIRLLKRFLKRVNQDFAEQKIIISKDGIDRAQARDYFRLLKACLLRESPNPAIEDVRHSLQLAFEGRDGADGTVPVSSFFQSFGLGIERFLDLDQMGAFAMQDNAIELPMVLQCVRFRTMLANQAPTPEALEELNEACCGMAFYAIRAMQRPEQAIEIICRALALLYREEVASAEPALSAARPALSSSSSASASGHDGPRAAAASAPSQKRQSKADTSYEKLSLYCNIPLLVCKLGGVLSDDEQSPTSHQMGEILRAVIDSLKLGIFPITFKDYAPTTIGTVFHVDRLKTLLKDLVEDLAEGRTLDELTYVENLRSSIRFDQVSRAVGVALSTEMQRLFREAISFYREGRGTTNLSTILQKLGASYLNIPALITILHKDTKTITAADIVSCFNFKPFLRGIGCTSAQIEDYNESIQGLAVYLHAALSDNTNMEKKALHAFGLLFREACLQMYAPTMKLTFAKRPQGRK